MTIICLVYGLIGFVVISCYRESAATQIVEAGWYLPLTSIFGLGGQLGQFLTNREGEQRITRIGPDVTWPIVNGGTAFVSCIVAGLVYGTLNREFMFSFGLLILPLVLGILLVAKGNPQVDDIDKQKWK